jgi:hypothetical protein
MPSLDIGLILLIFASLIFGFIVGAAITNWWHAREKRARAKEAAVQAAEPTVQVVQEEPAPILPVVPLPDRLAQLWRDESSGDLRIQLENRTFEKASELSAEERAKMVDLLRDWVAWLGFNPPSQPTPPPAAPQPMPASAPVISRPAPVSAVGAPVVKPETDKVTPARPMSMVEQVDLILQEMQADLPIQSSRIKLVDDMQHGIVVWIGLEHYAGIDNIPSEEGRKLVRSAVAEWERRAG